MCTPTYEYMHVYSTAMDIEKKNTNHCKTCILRQHLLNELYASVVREVYNNLKIKTHNNNIL